MVQKKALRRKGLRKVRRIMQEKITKKRGELVREFEAKHREETKDWASRHKGEILVAARMRGKDGHNLYIFRDPKRDRWSLYCDCSKCNGEILRLVKTTTIFNRLKKLF